VVSHLLKPLDDVVVAHLDGQLATVVQAAASEIDRAHDRGDAVGEQHLAVKLEMLELVDLIRRSSRIRTDGPSPPSSS